MRSADWAPATTSAAVRRRVVVACVSIAFASSCGGGSELVSCTVVSDAGTAGLVGICEESDPSMSDRLRAACTQADGGASGGPMLIYADHPCSHAGSIGGCRFVARGGMVAVWYYSNGRPPGMSPGYVQGWCAEMNPPGTFIPP